MTKMFEPVGKAKESKLPKMQIKANVLSMDLTTAEASFGTVMGREVWGPLGGGFYQSYQTADWA